jgi:hypothetical protein
MVTLIALAALAIAAIAATLYNLPIDGYHRVRTRHR